MVALYCLSTVLMIGYAAVFTLLAAMRSEFGFSETQLGAITASAFIAGFVAQLWLARFADHGHGGRLLRLGTLTALGGLTWMCFADSIASWIAARMLLGFGAGCVRPAMRRYAFVLDPANAGANLGRLAAWEMVGFLLGPVLASIAFELAGIRAPFVLIGVLLILLLPWLLKVEVPGTAEPLPRAVTTLLARPAMQACLLMGVAFYLAVGVFDAIWALFVADLGASQMFIGISMSAFTLPMIAIAPWAGGFAARHHVLRMLTLTMSVAMLAMFTYGFIDSIWWLFVPLLFHAVVDAMSVPGDTARRRLCQR